MKFLAISRAWLRKTVRSNRDVDVGFSGPKLKLSFTLDEPVVTRSGNDPTNDNPFYETDLDTLYGWYHGYKGTHEHVHYILYADIVPIKTTFFTGIAPGAVCLDNLVVEFESRNYQIPEMLKKHAMAAVDLFKKMKKLKYLEDCQEWENNTSLRVISFDLSGRLSCQKARYFDQVATNITLDWASGHLAKLLTIRIDVEPPVNGRLRPLSESNLANTLGVAVMFYNKEFSPIVRVRAGDLLASIPQRGLHCTASGVLEIDPCLQTGTFDYSLLECGMIKEIKHEIGLNKDEYMLFPVAFARELPRGGKPQLFFMALSKVGKERLCEAMASADEAFEYVVGDAQLSKSVPELTYDKFTYEGWACLKFSEWFIGANVDSLKRFCGEDE